MPRIRPPPPQPRFALSKCAWNSPESPLDRALVIFLHCCHNWLTRALSHLYQGAKGDFAISASSKITSRRTLTFSASGGRLPIAFWGKSHFRSCLDAERCELNTFHTRPTYCSLLCHRAKCERKMDANRQRYGHKLSGGEVPEPSFALLLFRPLERDREKPLR